MKAPNRVGRSAALRYQASLSDRELSVLRSVDNYRYLSAKQIEDLHFYNHAREQTAARISRRVLARLATAQVLHRLEQRTVGGLHAGSASYVYAVGPLGYRLLCAEGGDRWRRHEPSPEFLKHTLAVAQLVVDLCRVARTGLVELLTVETEPSCWRTFSRGLAGPVTLKPDLSLDIGVGKFEYRWFVEMDRGTTSVAAVLRKCRLYQEYWATGIEQERVGLYPRVVWVVPTDRRAGRLVAAMRKAAHLEARLFLITTMDRALTCLTQPRD